MKLEANIDKKALQNFGLITGVILSLLFGLLFPWIFKHELPYWPWIISSILWTCALIAPSLLFPVYRVWMKIGYVLGWINTRIILGIMFYLIFLPFGLIMRLLAKDPLDKKIIENKKSYRVLHMKRSRDHIERPF